LDDFIIISSYSYSYYDTNVKYLPVDS